MPDLRIGELFSGYSGLGMGVQAVLGGDIAWHSEIDKGACKILSHRYPGVPNLGDITTVNWSAVEPVDVLTAGYPCQPFSAAGKRQGTEDERHLWPHAATAIGNLRPEWVVLENVRGHLTLGFDQVLRDLGLLHYEARWIVLRAADVGAPHGRARIFILGRNVGRQLRSRTDRRRGVHRDPGGWRLDAATAEGSHDGQGLAQSASDVPDVRRASCQGPGGGGKDQRSPRLAPEWTESGGSDRATFPDVAHEGGAGPDRSRVPADDRRRTEAGEPVSGLERRDASASSDPSRPYSGSQPPRARRPGAESPIGEASGGLEVRRVVGTGRGSVRSGRVHGTLPDVGHDDRRSRLPAGHRASCIANAAELAWDASSSARRGPQLGDLRARPVAAAEPREPTGAAAPHASHDGRERSRPSRHGWAGSEDGAHVAADAKGQRRGEGRPEPARLERGSHDAVGGASPVDWGPYEPAIRRWERLTRPAPPATERGRNGQPRLSPIFVEWMQGLPAGWVTAVPGITRNEALKALGNGVVPQQCAAALRLMLPALERAA